MDHSVMDNASPLSQETHAEQAQKSAERLFRQAELNEIVGRAKHEAVESFKRQQTQQPSQQPSGHPSGLSEADIRRLASEELSRQRSAWAQEAQEAADAESAQRIVSAYKSKIAAGKEKYEDFDTVTNVDMRKYPNVVQLLAENVDNAHDVIYELSKHRTKMHQLQKLAEDSHQDAIYEVRRIAESIKANESTVQSKQAKAPLSQQKPSTTGMDSGKALSWKDLKSRYKG